MSEKRKESEWRIIAPPPLHGMDKTELENEAKRQEETLRAIISKCAGKEVTDSERLNTIIGILASLAQIELIHIYLGIYWHQK